MSKIKLFFEKYNLIALFVLVILTMQTYIFHSLSINTIGGTIYRAIVALVIFAYLVFYFLSIKTKPSTIFIILSSIYVITSITSLVVNPLIIRVAITGTQYLSSISVVFFNILSIYLFLSSSNLNNYKQQMLFLLIFISFVMFLCLYTYIFQYKNIYETLTNKYGWNYDVTSIFYVKTIYGFFLTLGSIYSAILWFKIKKIAILSLPLFFLINSVISRNKTSILIIGLLIVFLLSVLLIGFFKNKKKSFYILLSSTILVIALTIILIFAIETLRNFIRDSIINDGVVVIKARVEKWQLFLTNLSNPFNILFGYGERISNIVQKSQNVSDNIYLLSLETGGLFKLSIHLFLVVYLLRRTIKTNQYLFTFFAILILMSGLLEENYIYGFNLTSLASAPVIYGSLTSNPNSTESSNQEVC